MNYQHDITFDRIKRVKEQITVNYTSAQYLKTLDYFLWQAIAPIIRGCPTLFENYAAKMVAQQALRNSKLTSDDKTLLPEAFVRMLVSDDKLECAKNMHFNRGILFGFIVWFLSYNKKYVRVVGRPKSTNIRKRLRDNKYKVTHERKLNVTGNLYSIVYECQYWYGRATTFKNQIMEKYLRMVLTQAKNTYVDFNHRESLGDIIGVYVITLSKAIDRCDSRHGVLTTFIRNWFKGARSQVAEMIKEKSLTDSLDAKLEVLGDSAHMEIGSTPFDETFDAINHLAAVARREDPDGFVRSSLGIPEIATFVERDILWRLRKF